MTWHINKFKIEKIWNLSQGMGVKVAVLDSGFKEHPDILNDNIIATRNFLYEGANENKLSDVTDTLGHGTHCAGIIAAQIKCGVAPNVSLLIGKVTENGLGVNPDVLFKAIQWAYVNGADVISISITVDKFPKSYRDKIKVLDEKYKGILVCSLSDFPDRGFNRDKFPAMLPECIAVGAIDRDLKMDILTTRSSKIDVLAPGRDIESTWIDRGYKTLSGCSMATPFVAAIIALIISDKRNKDETIVKSEIKKDIVSKTTSFAKFEKTPQGNYPILIPLNQFEF
jgi:major intracellular serine protease